MPLSDIHDKFQLEASGRLDLSDAQMTAHINNGMRMLDQMFLAPEQEKFYQWDTIGDGTEGDYLKVIPDLRFITSVWSADVDDEAEMKGLTLNAFRKKFEKPIAELTPGRPAFFTVGPRNSILVSTPAFAQAYVPASSTEGDKVLHIRSKADAAYTMTVRGHFFSVALSADGDQNWWTEDEPWLLAWAALYSLEVTNRNTEGARDWLRSIERRIRQLDNDLASESAVGLQAFIG